MAVNYRFNNGGNAADFDDVFIRKDLFTQGGLWTWGRNSSGQLGDGSSIVHRSSPIQTISGGTNWKQVSSGSDYFSGIKTDGTLWMWGSNNAIAIANGQLGDNTIVHRSSPVQTVASGTNWKQVASGGWHSVAVKTDGTLWLWGANNISFGGTGQLGDNTIANKSSPVQTISAGSNWKQCFAGSNHTTAIKTDGTLWIWGGNSYGQLGVNDITHRSSPVQTITGGTNWKQVAGGAYHTAAIKTDGTLWIWGMGTSGQLGDNTAVNKSSPVQTVSSGTNWKQLASGGGGPSFQAAIKTDGTLWLWGQNTQAQLGDNTLVSKSSPVQTVAGGTNWKQVSSALYLTAAIKTDGTLWTWSANNINGQIGDNTVVNKSSPVQTVAGGTNWKQVACGGNNGAAAIREDYY